MGNNSTNMINKNKNEKLLQLIEYCFGNPGPGFETDTKIWWC